MGYDPAGAGYGAGGPQAPGGTVPHGTGGAAPGAWGGGGAGYGPGDGYGILGWDTALPFLVPRVLKTWIPMDLKDQLQLDLWVHHMVLEAQERAYLV